MVPAKTATTTQSIGMRDMASEFRIEDVAEGPDPLKAFRRSREVDPADNGRSNPPAEPDAAAVVKMRDVDVALEGDDLARVGEQRHVEQAEGVPAVFGRQVHRVVVLESVRCEPAQLVAAAEGW